MFVVSDLMSDKNLLSYLEEYLTEHRKNLFHEVLNHRTRHFTIVLEDIYQQHNASAVVRSCDVFGIQDIYAIENQFVNKVSKHVARGAQKWLTFHKYNKDTNNTQDCLDALRSKGYQIIATTPHNDSCVLKDFDISKRSALVFGLEKEGVSEDIMEQADGFLKIPMVGFTESLNISVAAAIILQDLSTRLRESAVDWQLNDDEKQELYQEWVEKSIKNVGKIKNHYFENIENK